MIGKILVADSGVDLHHLMSGTFVPNLKDQKIDFTGINLHNHSLVRTQRTAPPSSAVKCICYDPLHITGQKIL